MIKRTWCGFQSLTDTTDTGMWKGRKNRSEQMFPSTHLEWERLMGKELLEELRLLLGNKPCTEEPAVGEGAGMGGMEKVQNHFCQSTLNPQLELFVQETQQSHSSAFRTQRWVFNFTLGLKLPPKWSRAIQELRNSKCISLPFLGPHLF